MPTSATPPPSFETLPQLLQHYRLCLSILFHLNNRAPPAVEQHVCGGCPEIFTSVDGRDLSVREIVSMTVLLVPRQRHVVNPGQHFMVVLHTPKVLHVLVLVANLVSRRACPVVLAYTDGPLTATPTLRVLVAVIRSVEKRSPDSSWGPRRRILAAASASDPGHACTGVLDICVLLRLRTRNRKKKEIKSTTSKKKTAMRTKSTVCSIHRTI